MAENINDGGRHQDNPAPPAVRVVIAKINPGHWFRVRQNRDVFAWLHFHSHLYDPCGCKSSEDFWKKCVLIIPELNITIYSPTVPICTTATWSTGISENWDNHSTTSLWQFLSCSNRTDGCLFEMSLAWDRGCSNDPHYQLIRVQMVRLRTRLQEE